MSLLKEAREFIRQKFEENPRMAKEELMDLIRPHYVPNYRRLAEQDIGRIANYIAARVKDDLGVRQVFAINRDEGRFYIHVDKSNDVTDIKDVYLHLVKDRDGRDKSIAKVRKRGMEVAGQMSLEFEM